MPAKFMILLPLLAFSCEYVDSSLGMGYGTTLTPVLLLMGFEPLEVVPAVLLSELITGLLASVFHHGLGNVDFSRHSRSLHVALVLGLCSIVGTLFAVFVAVRISKTAMGIVIGTIILTMGLVILLLRNRTFSFSWAGITSLGVVASFNKGISGGGYGPLLVGGQLISGVEVKNAIGITQLAEAMVCLVGVIAYAFTPEGTMRIAPWLIIGAVASVPLATYTVKKYAREKLKTIVGMVTILLGVLTFIKVFNVSNAYLIIYVGLTAWMVFGFLFGNWAGEVARRKGLNHRVFFASGFILSLAGFIGGFLAVAAAYSAPDRLTGEVAP
jgi:uncharacterized protein